MDTSVKINDYLKRKHEILPISARNFRY